MTFPINPNGHINLGGREENLLEDLLMCENHNHVFDRRDTNHTRCIECKVIVNDPGRMQKLPDQNRRPKLIEWCNNLAKKMGVFNKDPKTGAVYECTEENFGRK